MEKPSIRLPLHRLLLGHGLFCTPHRMDLYPMGLRRLVHRALRGCNLHLYLGPPVAPGYLGHAFILPVKTRAYCIIFLLHFNQNYTYVRGQASSWRILRVTKESRADLTPVRSDYCLFSTSSTTWRTSGKHHFPFGFLMPQSHLPAFFSAAIFSIVRDLPLLTKSCWMPSRVYPKQ